MSQTVSGEVGGAGAIMPHSSANFVSQSSQPPTVSSNPQGGSNSFVKGANFQMENGLQSSGSMQFNMYSSQTNVNPQFQHLHQINVMKSRSNVNMPVYGQQSNPCGNVQYFSGNTGNYVTTVTINPGEQYQSQVPVQYMSNSQNFFMNSNPQMMNSVGNFGTMNIQQNMMVGPHNRNVIGNQIPFASPPKVNEEVSHNAAETPEVLPANKPVPIKKNGRNVGATRSKARCSRKKPVINAKESFPIVSDVTLLSMNENKSDNSVIKVCNTSNSATNLRTSNSVSSTSSLNTVNRPRTNSRCDSVKSESSCSSLSSESIPDHNAIQPNHYHFNSIKNGNINQYDDSMQASGNTNHYPTTNTESINYQNYMACQARINPASIAGKQGLMNPGVVQAFHQVNTVQVKSSQVQIMQPQYQCMSGLGMVRPPMRILNHGSSSVSNKKNFDPEQKSPTFSSGVNHAVTTTQNEIVNQSCGNFPMKSELNMQSNSVALPHSNMIPSVPVPKLGMSPAMLAVVPFGWKRLKNNEGQIVYVSPSGSELKSPMEVCEYLTQENTCKCGLQCPLRVENTFCFDPKTPHRLTMPNELTSGEATKVCNHRRKLAEAFTDHLQKQAKKEDGRKKRKRKASGDMDYHMCNPVYVNQNNKYCSSQQMQYLQHHPNMMPNQTPLQQQHMLQMMYMSDNKTEDLCHTKSLKESVCPDDPQKDERSKYSHENILSLANPAKLEPLQMENSVKCDNQDTKSPVHVQVQNDNHKIQNSVQCSPMNSDKIVHANKDNSFNNDSNNISNPIKGRSSASDSQVKYETAIESHSSKAPKPETQQIHSPDSQEKLIDHQQLTSTKTEKKFLHQQTQNKPLLHESNLKDHNQQECSLQKQNDSKSQQEFHPQSSEEKQLSQSETTQFNQSQANHQNQLRMQQLNLPNSSQTNHQQPVTHQQFQAMNPRQMSPQQLQYFNAQRMHQMNPQQLQQVNPQLLQHRALQSSQQMPPHQMQQMNPPQMHQITPQQMYHMNPHQMGPQLMHQMTPQLMQQVTSQHMSPQQMQQMTPQQMQQLATHQMQHFTPQQMQQLTPQQMQQLTTQQMQQLTPQQMQQLTPQQMQQLTPQQMQQLTPQQMQQLTPQQMQQLTPQQMQQLAPQQMQQLAPQQIQQLTPQQIQQMTPQQMQQMSAQQMQQMSAQQMQQLTTKQMQQVSPQQISYHQMQQMTPHLMQQIASQKSQQMTSQQMQQMTPQQMQQMTPQQMQQMTPQQMQQMTPQQMQQMTPQQMQQMTPQQMQQMTPHQMQQMTPHQMQQMTPQQMQQITPQQMQLMTPQQMQQMTPQQMQQMTPQQMQQMTPQQMQQMTPQHMQQLTPQQMQQLTPQQMQQLTPQQMQQLTPQQMQQLTPQQVQQMQHISSPLHLQSINQQHFQKISSQPFQQVTSQHFQQINPQHLQNINYHQMQQSSPQKLQQSNFQQIQQFRHLNVQQKVNNAKNMNNLHTKDHQGMINLEQPNVKQQLPVESAQQSFSHQLPQGHGSQQSLQNSSIQHSSEENMEQEVSQHHSAILQTDNQISQQQNIQPKNNQLGTHSENNMHLTNLQPNSKQQETITNDRNPEQLTDNLQGTEPSPNNQDEEKIVEDPPCYESEEQASFSSQQTTPSVEENQPCLQDNDVTAEQSSYVSHNSQVSDAPQVSQSQIQQLNGVLDSMSHSQYASENPKKNLSSDSNNEHRIMSSQQQISKLQTDQQYLMQQHQNQIHHMNPQTQHYPSMQPYSQLQQHPYQMFSQNQNWHPIPGVKMMDQSIPSDELSTPPIPVVPHSQGCCEGPGYQAQHQKQPNYMNMVRPSFCRPPFPGTNTIMGVKPNSAFIHNNNVSCRMPSQVYTSDAKSIPVEVKTEESKDRKKVASRSAKRTKTTIGRNSPCPNIDVRSLQTPNATSPGSIFTATSQGADSTSSSGNQSSRISATVSGPSFMEDPNGYLAQQTALLNSTMSGGAVGQFSPQGSRMSPRPASSTVNTSMNAKGLNQRPVSNRPLPTIVPLPSNVPLPARVSKASTSTPASVSVSVSNGNELSSSVQLKSPKLSENEDSSDNPRTLVATAESSCGSHTVTVTYTNTTVTTTTCRSASSSPQSSSNDAAQVTAIEPQDISCESLPKTKLSSKRYKESLEKSVDAAPVHDSISSSSANLSTEAANKPLTPGPAESSMNTQSPLELVQNIVSSIPMPASSEELHTLPVRQNPTQLEQTQSINHIRGPQVYNVATSNGMQSLMYNTASTNQNVLRGSGPLVVHGTSQAAGPLSQGVIVSNNHNMVMVTSPFNSKVSIAAPVVCTNVNPMVGVQTMPQVQVQPSIGHMHSQLQPIQPVVQLVNTFATMQAPVIIQNGNNILQSPPGVLSNHGSVIGPASILNNSNFVASQPLLAVDSSPHQLQVTQVVTSADDENRLTPASTPLSTPSTPLSGSSQGSLTPPSGGRKRKRRRNASTPQQIQPNIMPAIIMSKPQQMVMSNAQISPFGNLAGASVATVSASNVTSTPTGQVLGHQNNSPINVVQMVSGPMAAPVHVQQPTQAIIVPSNTTSGVIINQLADGSFVSTDPNTGVSYPVHLQLSGSHIVGMTPVSNASMVGPMNPPSSQHGTMVALRHSPHSTAGAKLVNLSSQNQQQGDAIVQNIYGVSASAVPVTQSVNTSFSVPCQTNPSLRQQMIVGNGNATLLQQKTTTIVAHQQTTVVATQGGLVETHSSVSTQTNGLLSESDVTSSDCATNASHPRESSTTSPSHQSAEISTTRQDDYSASTPESVLLTPPQGPSPDGIQKTTSAPSQELHSASAHEDGLLNDKVAVVWGPHRGQQYWPAQMLHQDGGDTVIQWYGDHQVETVSVSSLSHTPNSNRKTRRSNRGRTALDEAIAEAKDSQCNKDFEDVACNKRTKKRRKLR